ncbi:hypothetical protein AB6A40_009715 [Gnathostoma spinigerum]|uniref:Uncharacterized protein n=1 Tax=Gnathostoma spinigerum TaxID=75299 RepID=A0ABD6EZM8_9BILA
MLQLDEILRGHNVSSYIFYGITQTCHAFGLRDFRRAHELQEHLYQLGKKRSNLTGPACDIPQWPFIRWWNGRLVMDGFIRRKGVITIEVPDDVLWIRNMYDKPLQFQEINDFVFIDTLMKDEVHKKIFFAYGYKDEIRVLSLNDKGLYEMETAKITDYPWLSATNDVYAREFFLDMTHDTLVYRSGRERNGGLFKIDIKKNITTPIDVPSKEDYVIHGHFILYTEIVSLRLGLSYIMFADIKSRLTCSKCPILKFAWRKADFTYDIIFFDEKDNTKQMRMQNEIQYDSKKLHEYNLAHSASLSYAYFVGLTYYVLCFWFVYSFRRIS